MIQYLSTKEDITKNTNKKWKSSAWLRNGIEVNKGVNDSWNSEDNWSSRNLGQCTSSSYSKNKDQTNKWYDVFHVVEMSPESMNVFLTLKLL